MEGLPNIYNRIFGKTWAPNQIMPRWVIEGYATIFHELDEQAGALSTAYPGPYAPAMISASSAVDSFAATSTVCHSTPS